jgi:hypothetical protein
MGYGDVVSGTSLSDLVITNGQVGDNSCATKLEQSILINTVSPTITGGVCNSVTNNPQSQGINNHTIAQGISRTPTLTPTPTPTRTLTPTPTRTLTPTPTPPIEYTGEWTWRNQDLGNAGFSSAQINGDGIGTANMSPSVFPLTSTLYGVTNPPKSAGTNIAWNSTTTINIGMNWNFFVPGATYFIQILVNNVSVSLTTMPYGSPYNVVTLSGSTILSTDDVEVIVFGVV